jgi:hypothetical protein
MIRQADGTAGLTGFGIGQGWQESWMNTRNKAAIFVLIFSSLGFSRPTLAVKTVSPQIGTFAIDEEENGKPGRGFQISLSARPRLR